MKKIRNYFLCIGVVFFTILIFNVLSITAQDKSLAPSTPKVISAPEIEAPSPIPLKEGEDISDWVARWELARLLSYMKQYDDSIMEYRKLLKEKPDLYMAKVEMAHVLFWQGKHDEALNELIRIPSESMDEKAKILLADLHTANKNYTKAEPLYRNYLRSHPNDIMIRLKFADMLSWAKKYDDSLAEYETILKANPDDIQVRRKYAFVLIWAGKHSEAATELRKTLK